MEIDGDFVVFLIGARVNSKLQALRGFKDLGGSKGMRAMLAYLTEHPEKGLLGYQTCRVHHHPVLAIVRASRSVAKDKDDPHLEAWRNYWQRVGKTGRTGIWHETFLVHAGEYEAVYGNMPPEASARHRSSCRWRPLPAPGDAPPPDRLTLTRLRWLASSSRRCLRRPRRVACVDGEDHVRSAPSTQASAGSVRPSGSWITSTGTDQPWVVVSSRLLRWWGPEVGEHAEAVPGWERRDEP